MMGLGEAIRIAKSLRLCCCTDSLHHSSMRRIILIKYPLSYLLSAN